MQTQDENTLQSNSERYCWLPRIELFSLDFDDFERASILAIVFKLQLIAMNTCVICFLDFLNYVISN